ncbi:RNA polymerase sigma factor [Brevibacillus invocatus]|uniref:RNA polymerase sigma factor n=1 Tax=Brevibacillus invocatus TaxID=173959 RepID=UPI00203EE1AD|nr:sigma-70 family RNA polymerase sigma factor [Brevibacillus invocatus]MCM3428705.1 sigma-70 family RNA polymerase sigma factor [Brevibacillus invocatus]
MDSKAMEAEDAAQEVFIKAYRNLKKYNRMIPFAAWLYKIAFNHCMDLIRKRKWSRLLPFLQGAERGESQIDQHIEAVYFSEPVYLAMTTLSVEERTLLILRGVEEKTYEEIALIMNKNAASLRKKFERTAAKFRYAYSPQEKGGAKHAETVGLLASVTTAYAAVEYFQLKNEQGEVIYQEKDAAEAPNTIIQDPDGTMLAFMQKRAEVEEQMAPGTVAAVYIKEHNPKKSVDTIIKPFEFAKLEDMQQEVGGQFEIPQGLPGGFAFAAGSVEYEVDRDYDKEELYKLAEATDQDFVQLPLQWTDQLSHITVTYTAGEESIRVAVTNIEGVADNTVYYVNQDQRKTEKVVVDQIEALYAEQPMRETVLKDIVWVTEDTGAKLEYRISTQSPKWDVEAAKKMMKEFLTSK